MYRVSRIYLPNLPIPILCLVFFAFSQIVDPALETVPFRGGPGPEIGLVCGDGARGIVCADGGGGGVRRVDLDGFWWGGG